ncbi:hypothetical protein BCR43DRAFT_481859 [Syncephalastrum racemosum]|uniref:Arrestin C-terminal-like domain-containing protein n=1 Tax=Syncephalastrum racemosum TaxID=13706 RepID=A0A1X2HSS5_SYNRA|nr:hypothetical protein BCR43DRAFT_481859 [Syncephalastrum racemosum]
MLKSTNVIRSFNLTLTPGQNKLVAFGPGSVVNGSVVLVLDQPAEADSLRVVFKCELWDGHQRQTAVPLFHVEERLLKVKTSLSDGSHMYLFAIRLPDANYPPSIYEGYDGVRVEYTLQAFFDLQPRGEQQQQQQPDQEQRITDHNSTGSSTIACSTVSTAPVPILYLPLVTSDDSTPTASETRVFSWNDAPVRVTATLTKPSYTAGDWCTVKLTVDNRSDGKVKQIDLALACSVASQGGKHRQQIITSDTFYVSRHEQQSVLRIRLPDHCVPTFACHPSVPSAQQLDLSYHLELGIPMTTHSVLERSNNGGGWSLFSTPQTNNTLSLPLIVSTVPHGMSMHHTLPTELDLPVFCPTVESPMPSPTSPSFFSRAGSPVPPTSSSTASVSAAAELDRLSLSPSTEEDPVVDTGVGAGNVMGTTNSGAAVMQQDASGHLMVPT